jgi:hypothetical protein
VWTVRTNGTPSSITMLELFDELGDIGKIGPSSGVE